MISRQDDGKYVIQSVGNNLYLTFPAERIVGNKVVGSSIITKWDLQSIGGFSWACVFGKSLSLQPQYTALPFCLLSIKVPDKTLSLGFADYEVQTSDEVS